MQQVIILSGPPGAGKTATADAICERFDRMVHIEVDTLHEWVRAGYRVPWGTDAQAVEQRRMSVRSAAAVARQCIAHRYAVVIDDTVLAADAEIYREALSGLGAPVHLVTLLPSLATALQRDAPRGRDSIPDRVRIVHGEISAAVAAGELPGVVLDSTNDPDARATADRIQDAIASGTALLIGMVI